MNITLGRIFRVIFNSLSALSASRGTYGDKEFFADILF